MIKENEYEITRLMVTATYTTGQILAVSGGFGLATPVYADLVGKASGR